jgi:hypothetical protein
MPFIPIIAFCAAIAGEPDMNRCTWVSDESIHPRTETACIIRAHEIRRNQNVIVTAMEQPYNGHQWTGPAGYALFCIDESEESDFWKSRGLS